MYNQHRLLRLLQLIASLRKAHPKTISQLQKLLVTTERSVYRYFDLLREAGFELIKTQDQQFYIESDISALQEGFTNEEADFLKKLLLSTGKNHKLRDAVLKKIYLNSELQIQGEHIARAHLSKIIQDLSLAMEMKKRVILQKYQSAHSQKISDRAVEPIHFTVNYQSVYAYEIKSGKNKLFNIERIGSVKIMDTGFKYFHLHKIITTDIFGFAEQGEIYRVKLKLNLRACLLIQEEYPLCRPFICPDKKGHAYLLEMYVYDMRPVERFVAGLPGDVKLLSSKNEKC